MIKLLDLHSGARSWVQGAAFIEGNPSAPIRGLRGPRHKEKLTTAATQPPLAACLLRPAWSTVYSGDSTTRSQQAWGWTGHTAYLLCGLRKHSLTFLGLCPLHLSVEITEPSHRVVARIGGGVHRRHSQGWPSRGWEKLSPVTKYSVSSGMVQSQQRELSSEKAHAEAPNRRKCRGSFRADTRGSSLQRGPTSPFPRKTTHPLATDNLKDGRIRNDAALIGALSHTHINETFWFKLEVNRHYSNLRQIMSLLQSSCSLESRPNCFKMVRLQYSRRKLCETPVLPSPPWMNEFQNTHVLWGSCLVSVYLFWSLAGAWGF